MNDRVLNEKDFLAGAEAQAAQDFLRRHMAEVMTSSQIERLIRHVGVKTRRDLQYLTEEDFCDPIKSCLKTEVIPAIPVRMLMHSISQFLRTAREWKVQYDEYGDPSIYEETQMLARSALDPQGHAQGMIEPERKPPPPNLSCDDLVFELPAHVLSIQEAQTPLHTSLSANPTGTSPTVSRGIVHSPAAPVDFANCRQAPRVHGLSPRPLQSFMTSGPNTTGGPADSLYNVWPQCSFCGRQESNVQSYSIPERLPLLLCLSCYHTVLQCQGINRGVSAGDVSSVGSLRMDALGGISRSQGGYREPPDLVVSLRKRMPDLPVKHGIVDHQSSAFLHYRDSHDYSACQGTG